MMESPTDVQKKLRVSLSEIRSFTLDSFNFNPSAQIISRTTYFRVLTNIRHADVFTSLKSLNDLCSFILNLRSTLVPAQSHDSLISVLQLSVCTYSASRFGTNLHARSSFSSCFCPNLSHLPTFSNKTGETCCFFGCFCLLFWPLSGSHCLSDAEVQALGRLIH